MVSIDGHALFSATQRANGGRARWKHGGQTASVYLTDEVAEQKGKYQIGTLCHTLALKKGPIILDSVPTFKQKHIQPLLEFLPENTPVFSDDGYPWYRRYNLNHRSVNHSARAKDRKRSLWARDRWSRFGVHNNVAEGNGRILKHAFIAGYSYVSPEKSKMYLNEFSSLKAIRIYSLSGLGNVGESDRSSASRKARKPDHGYLRRKIAALGYLPPTHYERDFLDRGNARKLIRKNLRELLDQNEFYEARQAHLDYLGFWQDAAPYRKQLERRYSVIAQELWKRLHRWDERLLVKIAQEIGAPHRLLMRMTRKWKQLGLASYTERKNPEGKVIHFWAKRSVAVLPDMLYSFDMRQYRDQQIKREVVRTDQRLSKYGMNKQDRKKALERGQ